MRLSPLAPFLFVGAAVLAASLGGPGTSAARSEANATRSIEGAVKLGAGPWWRGNTHTHTLWSDGDGAPEVVARWYREHGYQFLVLSDHNVLSVLTRFFPVKDGTRLTAERVEAIRRDFGEAWVEERVQGEERQMRLKTLPELRERFEAPGEFLFVQGEEVTDAFQKSPVHMNAMNLESTIEPARGPDVVTVMRNNLRQVLAQGEELGRPVLAHLNHPNFYFGVSADDLAQVTEEQFFEVYNGHPSVHNHGDAEHPSTDRIWDEVLTARLTRYGGSVLYGVATDDAHHYFQDAPDKANTGAGWVMVQCDSLDPDSLVAAMLRGDFYASSGVTLARVEVDEEGYEVEVSATEGVTYRIEFVGTRVGEDREVGEVLESHLGPRARYEFQGDELYVRARVVSDRLHPRPSELGDLESAWTQPVVLRPAR